MNLSTLKTLVKLPKRSCLWITLILSPWSSQADQLSYLDLQAVHRLFQPQYEVLSPAYSFVFLKSPAFQQVSLQAQELLQAAESHPGVLTQPKSAALLQLLFFPQSSVQPLPHRASRGTPPPHLTGQITGQLISELIHSRISSPSPRILEDRLFKVLDTNSFELSPRFTSFSEQSDAQSALAHTLAGAFEENPTEPLAELLLMSFFISQDPSKADLLQLLENLSPALTPAGFELLSQAPFQSEFLRSDSLALHDQFIQWLKRFDQLEQSAANQPSQENAFLDFLIEHPVETVALAFYPEQLSRICPPQVPFGISCYEEEQKAPPKYYPDCGETALLNWFNFLLYEPKTGRLEPELLQKQADHHGFQIHPLLAEFYQQNAELFPHSLETMRHQWLTQVIAKLDSKEIRFNKGQCELASGIRNSFQVLDLLLWNSDASLKSLPLSRKLTRLCEVFSRENHILSWQESVLAKKIVPQEAAESSEGLSDSLRSVDVQDTQLETHFLVNGMPAFSYHFWPIAFTRSALASISSQTHHPRITSELLMRLQSRIEMKQLSTRSWNWFALLDPKVRIPSFSGESSSFSSEPWNPAPQTGSSRRAPRANPPHAASVLPNPSHLSFPSEWVRPPRFGQTRPHLKMGSLTQALPRAFR
ncbi:MAG: hypothetical protein ACO3A2_00595 [Bdellovibrionia bacterium]